MSTAAVAQAAASPSDTADIKHVHTLLQMATGYWTSQCLYVAAALRIADALHAGPKAIDVLARETKSNEDYLYRVMRAACSVGVFEEKDGRTFAQTPLSNALRSDNAHSALSMVEMMGREEHFKAWGHLLESVQKGDRPFEAVFGMPVFEYFAKHPEAGEVFNKAMTCFATSMHRTVIGCYDFSRFKTLVDVGGGHGALLRGILESNPGLNGVLFDLPHVVQGMPPSETLPEALQSRFKAVGGDFFQSIHPGADAYILSTVIHDWSDELSIQILKNIHAAMAEKGTLLLVENVIDPDNRPHFGKFLDLNMLVMTEGGRERSREEFKTLYEAAGFELSQVIPLPSGLCIIEGIKQEGLKR
jgi:hypothetical protein